MNKTTITGIIIAIVAFSLIVWMARPGPRNGNTASITAQPSGILSAEETSFDFGAISMASGKVSHSFKIKNKSPEPATIEKIYTSCMCTTASLVTDGLRFGPYGMPGHGFIPKINKIIDLDEEAIIEVVFDPAAHGPAGIGPIQRLIAVEKNGGERLELSFSAMVTP